jgi:gamma-aminobutyric acid type B receptor
VLLGGALVWHGALTTTVCRAQLWSLALGFTLLYGPMFAKLWRVHLIFDHVKIKQSCVVTDRQLLEVVAALLCVDALTLGVWQGVSPTVARSSAGEPVPTADAFVYEVPEHATCVSDAAPVAVPVVLAWKAALLVTGSLLAFRTRRVATRALNDSKWVGLSVYSTTLVSALCVPLAFVVGGDNPEAAFILASGSVFLVVVTAVSLLFVPKFFAIWTGNEEEWLQDVGGMSGSAAQPGKSSFAASRHRKVSGLASPRSAVKRAAGSPQGMSYMRGSVRVAPESPFSSQRKRSSLEASNEPASPAWSTPSAGAAALSSVESPGSSAPLAPPGVRSSGGPLPTSNPLPAPQPGVPQP